MEHLLTFGWNDHFARQMMPGESLTHVARVVQEHKEAYLVRAVGAGMGNVWAEISGKMRHEGAVRADFPAVGDWVVLRGLRVAKEGVAGAAQATASLAHASGPVSGP